MKGLVTKATGSWYNVLCENGEVIASRLPGKFRLSDEALTNPVAVGDLVDIDIKDGQSGVIEHIHDRKSRLVRKATHGKRGLQIIAANVDQVLIIQSVKKPALKTGFIDRVLVTCEAYGIDPVLVFNKMDLLTSQTDIEAIQAIQDSYRHLGYKTAATSIHATDCKEQLSGLIKNKISVMTGPSGTGKTSLLNLLDPSLSLKTGSVSDFSNKGKHTTTFAQLIDLGERTYIVDTPGIREFGICDVEPFEIAHYFPEMKPLLHDCRYNTCIHRHEPSCAIKEAVKNNDISLERYRSYLNILESIENDSNKG